MYMQHIFFSIINNVIIPTCLCMFDTYIYIYMRIHVCTVILYLFIFCFCFFFFIYDLKFHRPMYHVFLLFGKESSKKKLINDPNLL